MKDYHSRSYHRCFEGFVEKWKEENTGKREIRRIYTGIYYIPETAPSDRRNQKLGSLLLYVAAAVLYGISGTLRTALNSSWYGAFLQMFLLFLFGMELFWIWDLEDSGTRLTVRSYKNIHIWWMRSTMISATLLLSLVFLSPLAQWQSGTGMGYLTWITMAGYGLGGLAMGRIALWEKAVTYRTESSEQTRPEKSVLIRY